MRYKKIAFLLNACQILPTKKVLQVYVYIKNRILHGGKVLFAHIVTYSGSSVNR